MTKPDLFTLNCLVQSGAAPTGNAEPLSRVASSLVGQKSLGKAHVKIPSLPDLEREVEVRLSPGVPLSPRVRAAVLCVEDDKL